jgi:hypothetical protein
MTPEGKVKDKVKKMLKAYGAYYHCPVQNGMGEPTLDFICCHNGRFFAIETKAPGGKPTKRQEVTMYNIAFAGGFVFVISNQEQLDILECYLQLTGT